MKSSLDIQKTMIVLILRRGRKQNRVFLIRGIIRLYSGPGRGGLHLRVQGMVMVAYLFIRMSKLLLLMFFYDLFSLLLLQIPISWMPQNGRLIQKILSSQAR